MSKDLQSALFLALDQGGHASRAIVFDATGDKLAEASLLVHVVDLTSPQAPEQCRVVEDILADLGVADKPRITALNKIDRLVEDEQSAAGLSRECPAAEENTVLVSAEKRWGLPELLATISRVLPPLELTT